MSKPKANIISKFEYDTLNDNIYVNVLVSNGAAGASPAPLVITQTLASDIVKNPSAYYLSVIRWQLDGGSSLPIMIFPDGTLYVVLGFGGFYASQVLTFPGYGGPIPPGFPTEGIYSYEAFAQAMNTAIDLAFTALGGMVVLPIGSAAPYVYYNPGNYKFDIFYDANYLESVPIATRIQFFMNYQLFRLFNNYAATFTQNAPPAPHADYLLRVYDQMGMNTPPLAAIPAGRWIMTQEFPAPSRLSTYNGVQTIQIKSSTLGARFEFVVSLDASLQAPSSGSALPSTNLITDFVTGGATDVGNPAGYRQQLVYLPSAQYKLTDVLAGSLTSMDLNIVWTDPAGKQYPYMLMPGSTAAFKIAFIHRSLIKNFSETIGAAPVLPHPK